MSEMMQFDSLVDLQRWCAADFRNYIRYRCSQLDFQASWIHLDCAEKIQAGHQFFDLLGFRKAAKTKWFGMEYACWRWLRVPTTKIIVQCNTDTNAGLTTSGIKDILLEEPILRHLAPQGTVADKYWNVHGIRPERGHSIRSAGVDTILTSERADVFIIDDPESNDNPETVYDRVMSIFDESLVILSKQGRLFPGRECPVPERTQRIILGQPHWEGSAYVPPPPDPNTGETDDHPLRGDFVYTIPAMVNSKFEPDDEVECLSSVPEIISHESMREMKTKLTRRKWRLNMMIRVDPEDAERPVIRLDHIHCEDVLQPDFTIAVIDPADAGASEWGVVAGGVCNGRYHFCLMAGLTEDYVAECEGIAPNHESIGELMWMHVFDLLEAYGVNVVYIEKNWAPAIRSCRRYIHKHGLTLPVEEFHVHASKLRRIVNQWELPNKNGLISANPAVLFDRMNRKQMANLRHHRLPSPCDRIDAGGKMLEVLAELSPVEMVPDEQRVVENVPDIAGMVREYEDSGPSDPLQRRRRGPGLSLSRK